VEGNLLGWGKGDLLLLFTRKGPGKRLGDKIEGDKYLSITITPSRSGAVDIVLEEIPDLCNTSHNSRSFDAIYYTLYSKCRDGCHMLRALILICLRPGQITV